MGTSPAQAAARLDAGQQLSIKTLGEIFDTALERWNPAEMDHVSMSTKHSGVRDEKVMAVLRNRFADWNIEVVKALQPYESDTVTFKPKNPAMPMAPLTQAEQVSVQRICEKWIEPALDRYYQGMASITFGVTHPDITSGKVRAGIEKAYPDWVVAFDVPPRDGIGWMPTVTMSPRETLKAPAKP